MRMDFSPDGTQLAIAAVTAQEGQIISNLYLLNLRAGEPQLLASEPGSTPLDLQWMSNDRLLAVYDTHAALFGSSGAVQARREFGGAAVAGVSVGQGGAAVLLGSGQLSTTALVLDAGLNTRYEGPVPSANDIVWTADAFYLLCDSSVECFSLEGAYQWSMPLDARPQAMVAGKGGLFVLTENMARRVTPPAQDQEQAGSPPAA